MKKSLLDDFNLNPEQHQAANTLRGGVEIVAGPGTGKTHTLVARAVRLIETGVKPSNICIVTFTNKAAAELKERVATRVGKKGKGLWATTFHGLGLRLLYWTMSKHGNDRFPTILDEHDSVKLLRNHLIETRPDLYDPQKKIRLDIIIERYNMAREGGYSRKDIYPIGIGTSDQHKIRQIIKEYENVKQRCYAFDFCDLLYCVVNSPYRNQMRFRFSHVMVDEAHDMNRIQLEMARMLAGRNLCIIYDEDQSIYEWRGANPTNLEVYRKLYPDHRRVILTRNYRCCEPIIDKSLNLIRRNANRVEKALISIPGDGPAPTFDIFDTADDEAAWIATQAQCMHAEHDIAYEDMAILFRTNQQALILERELHNYGLKVKIQDGRSLFTREIVKVFLAYVTVCVDARNDLALERVINEPSRGVGEKALEKLRQMQEKYHCSLWEVIATDKHRNALELPDSTKGNIATLARALAAHYVCCMNATEITKARRIVSLISNLYTSTLDNKDKTTLQAIQDDLAAAIEKGRCSSIFEWLFNAHLASTGDTSAEEGSVNLYTMHASKGLEFEVVFVSGMEQGICPWGKGRTSQERKLAYVAMTRAKRYLFLTAAEKRFLAGKTRDSYVSQFIDETFTPYVGDQDAESCTETSPTKPSAQA